MLTPRILLALLTILAISITIPIYSSTKIMDNHPTLTLGGGCFWCLEAVYEIIPGVLSVTSGYAGGTTNNPTYEQVCSGATGHAEVIQITYNPQTTSLEKLLDLFWQIHDPTTPNRQGYDIGTQYRSIILYTDPQQETIARQSLQQAQKLFPKPIVTEIIPLQKFYPAEDYHQDYFRRNPHAPYCRTIIQPKINKTHHWIKDTK
jgi:peptide-methionine (S)-S-oxide reductase